LPHVPLRLRGPATVSELAGALQTGSTSASFAVIPPAPSLMATQPLDGPGSPPPGEVPVGAGGDGLPPAPVATDRRRDRRFRPRTNRAPGSSSAGDPGGSAPSRCRAGRVRASCRRTPGCRGCARAVWPPHCPTGARR